MQDLLFVAITLAFFGLAALYIRGCAHLAGDQPGEVVSGSGSATADEPAVSSTAVAR